MSRKPRLGQVNPALSTLYSAPDVQEARRLRGGIAEISPTDIETDGRLEDRLTLDVESLKASIEANGQRVPVLVRPLPGDRYRLIYGRRRLEACRLLGRPVRAIVTDLDEDQSLKDQLIENLERRDLSFIERALVAQALLDGDQLAERSNRAVAEILNLTEAGVSQLLSVVKTVGPEVIHAIGAAPGIGRPRWEELKRACLEGADREALAARAMALRDGSAEASDRAFLAVLAEAAPRPEPAPGLTLEGIGTLSARARGHGFKLELEAENKGFSRWLAENAAQLVTELHARWKQAED